MNEIARALLLSSSFAGAALGQQPQLLGVQRVGLFTPHPVLDIDIATAQTTELRYELAECDGLAFGPDGLLYANTYPDLVRVDPATGEVLGVVAGVGTTSDLALHPVTGDLFVSYRSSVSIDVVDRTSGSFVGSLPALWETHGVAWNALGTVLYGTTLAGELYEVVDGAIASVVDLALPPGARPVALAVHPISDELFVSLQVPGDDGQLAIVDPASGSVTVVGTMVGWGNVSGLTFAALPLGEITCPGVPNSTGLAATLRAAGSVGGEGHLLLVADALPPHETGLFLASRTATFLAFVRGSSGTLCVGAPFARVRTNQGTSGAAGVLTALLDPDEVPLGAGTVIAPGETWYFQAWYSDGPLSNFSSARSIRF